MACDNNRPCPCTYDCPRHGKCCACVAHHRDHGEGVPRLLLLPGGRSHLRPQRGGPGPGPGTALSRQRRQIRPAA